VCPFISLLEYLRNHMTKRCQLFKHIHSDRGSVLLRRRCDMLCTSGFVDGVMFSHSGAPRCVVCISKRDSQNYRIESSQICSTIITSKYTLSVAHWGRSLLSTIAFFSQYRFFYCTLYNFSVLVYVITVSCNIRGGGVVTGDDWSDVSAPFPPEGV